MTGEDLARVSERAAELAEALDAFRPDQFGSESNVRAHVQGTGLEIWEQTGGRVDAWVASVGTGGTFLGVSRALKTRNPRVRCLAAEPASAPFIAGGAVTSPRHKIQGTGYLMIPPRWEPELCDGFLTVSDAAAEETTRELARREGILGGYSSGANVWAALQVARVAEPGEVIVTVCPDTGLKYLSTDLYP